MSGTVRDQVGRTVSECERYWRTTGVPRDAVAEMSAELEQHLREAQAEGKPVSSVVGEDLGAFAEEWAREFRPPVAPPRLGPARGPAILALVGAILAVVGAGMAPVWEGGGVVECCPERVIEETARLSPAGAWMAAQSLVAAGLGVAAAVALFRGRRSVGAVLLALGLPTALFTPFGLWLVVLYLIALVWAMRPWRPGPSAAAGWAVASLTLAVASSVVLAFAPLGTAVESTAGGPGQATVETVTRTSLVQTEGPWVLVLLAVPVVIAAVPVTWRRSPHVRALRWASAALLFGASLVGAASIGFAYFPSAMAMVLAAALDRSPAPAPPEVGLKRKAVERRLP